MAKKGNENDLMISKLLVAVMLAVIIAAAIFYVWTDYNKGCSNQEKKSSEATQEKNDVDEEIQKTDEQTLMNSESTQDEIEALDKSINSINDDSLSETSLSDSDLGI